jgi:hypothetical protein
LIFSKCDYAKFGKKTPVAQNIHIFGPKSDRFERSSGTSNSSFGKTSDAGSRRSEGGERDDREMAESGSGSPFSRGLN